jgi:hypothetical protein
MRMWIALAGVVAMVGCSSSGKQAQPAAAAPAQAAGKNTNPYAKYVEVVGFRVNEKSSGHLEVRFAVVNHSEADLGEVKMDVNLQTTAAKPGDPPLVSFSTKIPALGPAELKPVTVDVPTKLRVYELPDWQFLKADFQLTKPQ